MFVFLGILYFTVYSFAKCHPKRFRVSLPYLTGRKKLAYVAARIPFDVPELTANEFSANIVFLVRAGALFDPILQFRFNHRTYRTSISSILVSAVFLKELLMRLVTLSCDNSDFRKWCAAE